MSRMANLVRMGVPRGQAGYFLAAPPALSPSLGAEAFTNGDFSAWGAGDNPDNWTVFGESAPDPEISEVGTGEGHGGTGTGHCNIYASGTNAGIIQNALTGNLFYAFDLTVDTIIAGGLVAYLGEVHNDHSVDLTVAQLYSLTQRAGGTEVRINRRVGLTDVTLASVSGKPLSNTYSAAHAHAAAQSYNAITLTLQAMSQAGLWQRHTGSGDQVLAYLDGVRGKLWLLSYISGTWAEVNSASVTINPGKRLKLSHPADNQWVAYYDTAVNIDNNMASAVLDETIANANLNACDADGYFATSASTTFSNYRWVPA